MLGHTKLFRFEQTSGLLMIGAMVLALVAANSPLATIYSIVHHTPVHIRFGPLVVDEPLVRWVNEGLMVIFFVLVGGMAVPAFIYLALNGDDPSAIGGWAIPTATDIVLALGVLSLLGSRMPTGLKIFLTALAIFDDIGAVAIIGLFYGEGLAPAPLAVAGLAVAGLAVLNIFRITYPAAFVAIGLVLWVAMLRAGVEAASAGILIALAIPLRAPESCRCSSPLRETERRLHPWGVLLVVPLFAFFNAGIARGGRHVSQYGDEFRS